MEESSDQAVHLGVNVTIFIIALSISITLLIGVRDLATKSIELGKSISTGTIVEMSKDDSRHIVSGYDLIGYYYNYIMPFYSDEYGNKEYLNEDIDIRIKKLNVAQVYIMKGKNDEFSYHDLKEQINLQSYYEVLVSYSEIPVNGQEIKKVIYITELESGE